MFSIKVTIPDARFAQKKWLDKIASTQKRESVQELRKLFNQTVFGWSEKPRMGWAQTKSADEIVLRIFPAGAGSDTWNLLNEGARAHPITPKKFGGFLRFRTGYRAATSPGQLQSRRAYRSGPYVGAKAVAHPGFEARKFTELIAQEYFDRFGLDMQKAINEAIGT